MKSRLGEFAGRLEIRDFIHQSECLQRCVGAVLTDGAGFPSRRIEVDHGWRRNRAPPVAVDTATVQALTTVFDVGIVFRRAGQLLPQSWWLVRFDRWPADLIDQQSRDCQSGVANHL